MPVLTSLIVLAAAAAAPPAPALQDPAPPRTDWAGAPAPGDAAPLYPGARPPLEPQPFPKLPVGAVRPGGWLRACLERQRDGMTGALPRISAWLQKEDNAWLSPQGEGRWGWEEVPYWLRGYLEIGHLLNDHAMLAEAQIWIEGALASQRPDGNFGPVRRFEDDGSQDFWANMVMLHCLRTHYEATGDERVLAFLRAYFRYQLSVPDEAFLTHYWQNRRGGDNLDVVHWLYERTGDDFLLELAAKLHRNTLDWAPADGVSADRHNVNIAQGFREPAQWWRQSHDPADLQATRDAFRVVRRDYGPVPGGMFGGDEISRPGFDDPRQAIETCALVEQIRSDALLFRITGDPFWAGHAERVGVNQLPSAFLPDFRGLRYLGSPNQVASDAANHAPGIFNGGAYFLMSALSHRCCQHNHSHGFSGLVQNLWTATADRGLCAAIYGASRVRARVGDGREVRITEETRYPFEEEVALRLHCAQPVAFPLYLRVPAWCAAPELRVNGEVAALRGERGERAGFLRVERRWEDGDRVILHLPMALRVKTWEDNHGAVSVHRGPLVFSLRIRERRVERDPAETALGGSRWREELDLDAWPAVELLPDSPWNYALVLEEDRAASFAVETGPWPEDDFPFTAAAAPLRLRATGQRVPEWQLDRHGLCAELQDGPVLTEMPEETVELIPMGAARLRITAFPVAATGTEGVRWEPPARPQKLYQASASHCWEGDQVAAIADGLEPEHSNDHAIARHTFWPRRGTTEWLQAQFEEPRAVSGIAVYWFDDRAGGGGCRVPASARLLMRVDGDWKPVPGAGEIGVERDRFNEVSFPEIVTQALRLEVRLRDGHSAGVLEWRIH